MGKGAGKFTLGHALVSAALGLGTYYGMRLLGASELHALMAAAVVSALRVVYTALRDKRFDIVAGFIMLMHGVTLVVALLTSSRSWRSSLMWFRWCCSACSTSAVV